MMGVPRSVAEHWLNIQEGYLPVRQKKRGQAPERARAIQVEVQKLVEVGIMREVYYHDWLSNPVMVKKHDGSWRMCVDFTDLNKACYHQIQMAESDEEKTAFHTSHEVYCYTKMPFGLKNAGATYQRLVDKAFDDQFGRNIEVYVDDMVIKSHTETEMLRDIDETFRTLRKINMKLNPKKCTFWAVEGMFLGYMISPKGIKPCPEKTEAVLFLSKSAEKSLPLFKTLKKCIKKSDFHWTPEAEQAFKQLKQHLSELPMLVAPKPKEEFIVYLSASHGAISAVLMTERDTVQTPVYFVSRTLQGPELNYTPMEKLVLTLVFAAKRLRRYFQAHPIAVITDQHIKQIISRPDVAGRLQKWSVMLGEHNITYRPKTSVKGQILADFLVEKPDEAPPDTSVVETPQEPWTLFTDGSSCVDGSGAGLILTSSEGKEFTYALRFQFTASNNEAEYEELIAGLRIAAQMGVRNVNAKILVSGFANFSISQVPRSKNKKADALSKIASPSFTHLSKQVLVEVLKEKSIQENEVETVVEEDGPTWMTPIMEYLKDETLPDDRKEASKLRIKARQYELLEGVLYRRSFLKPWLRCVGPLQADYVIREIHEGSCSMHTGPRSVVAKAMRLGYYWPTMHRDARDMIRKCSDSGPFLEGPGKVKFLIVAMDYFTKWIEAKAVATIIGSQVKKFVWDNIVCRFGLPGEIVSDNGRQFSDNPFKDWCEKLNITQRFASVKHLQSNGLVKRANRSLEVVIPAEIEMPTYRTAVVDAVHNNEELWLNLDLLEERCERATIRKAKAELKMTKYYNARVRGVTFRPGDFVYRSNDASHAVDGGKLGPKWEGPYEVTEALGDGAYRLRSMDGTVLPRTWNIANLKKCYL
ncbi:reverse transcriptase domain-containing protein [Tanacetum coccineum]